MPKVLSEKEVETRLRDLEGWVREGDFISKSFEFEEFMDGVSFVKKVAVVAETEKHHPDIHIRYTTVKLLIQTHSAAGITSRDFGLASAIEKMYGRLRK